MSEQDPLSPSKRAAIYMMAGAMWVVGAGVTVVAFAGFLKMIVSLALWAWRVVPWL